MTLPTNWTEKALREVATFNPRHSRDLADDLDVSFVPMPAVSHRSRYLLPHGSRKLSEVKRGYTHFQDGDMLFAKITPCMENGKGAIASDLTNGIGCGTTELHVLRPGSSITSEWIYYFVRQEQFRKEAERNMTGSAGQLRVPLSFLEEQKIPTPDSVDEQRRIVAKLDQVTACIDDARARLDTIPAILKRFRQSILTAAISGELTKRDSDISHWQNTDVQSVALVGTGSTPLRTNSRFYSSQGTPWITSAATSQRLVVESQEFVTDEAITTCRLKRYPAGTLLMAMYGEGKTRGQVTELGIEATINQACAAIKVDELKAKKEFVKLSLQANYLKMRDLAEGGNQPNLNLSKVKEFPLFLPPLDIQTEIVRRVEALFKQADEIEARYKKSRAFVEKLTPAVLAKAFRGELV